MKLLLLFAVFCVVFASCSVLPARHNDDEDSGERTYSLHGIVPKIEHSTSDSLEDRPKRDTDNLPWELYPLGSSDEVSQEDPYHHYIVTNDVNLPETNDAESTEENPGSDPNETEPSTSPILVLSDEIEPTPDPYFSPEKTKEMWQLFFGPKIQDAENSEANSPSDSYETEATTSPTLVSSDENEPTSDDYLLSPEGKAMWQLFFGQKIQDAENSEVNFRIEPDETEATTSSTFDIEDMNTSEKDGNDNKALFSFLFTADLSNDDAVAADNAQVSDEDATNDGNVDKYVVLEQKFVDDIPPAAPEQEEGIGSSSDERLLSPDEEAVLQLLLTPKKQSSDLSDHFFMEQPLRSLPHVPTPQYKTMYPPVRRDRLRPMPYSQMPSYWDSAPPPPPVSIIVGDYHIQMTRIQRPYPASQYPSYNPYNDLIYYNN